MLGSVERTLGVVGQAGVVVDTGADQLGQDAAVHLGGRVRADLLLDGPAGDLVAEPQARAVGDEQAGGDGLVEGADVGAGDGGEQVGLDPLADEGRGVEHVSTGRREAGGPGEHGVAG